MTESDSRLVPMLCPSCGSQVANTGAFQVMVETRTGRLYLIPYRRADASNFARGRQQKQRK